MLCDKERRDPEATEAKGAGSSSEALAEAEITVSAGGVVETVRTAVKAARAQWLVQLSLSIVHVIWGSTYFAIGVGLETFPPLLLGGTRFVLAGSILYGALRGSAARRTRPRGSGAQPRGWACCFSAAATASSAIAQQWVSSGVAAVMVSTMPLWVALFTSLVARGAADREGARRARPRVAPRVEGADRRVRGR